MLKSFDLFPNHEMPSHKRTKERKAALQILATEQNNNQKASQEIYMASRCMGICHCVISGVRV